MADYKRYEADMPKTKVLPFIEDVLRNGGFVKDIAILYLDTPHTRQVWILCVRCDERCFKKLKSKGYNITPQKWRGQ